MTPDEFKKLVSEIGGLIDKRAETTEAAIMAHVSTEIKKSEERMSAKLEETKEELRAEILVSRAEAKAENLRLARKIDKITTRVTNLEEKTETPNPHKN